MRLKLFILIPIFIMISKGVLLTTQSTEIKIPAGDVTLFIRVVGNPTLTPVMIAVNGGPGQSSHYMQSLDQLAGPNLTVVTFDQRGTGRSSEPTGGYNLDKYIEDIKAIRLHLKAEKIILFGHSFGGVISLHYTSLNPERVSSLILMGSGPPALSLIGPAQMRLGAKIQKLVQQGIITGPQPTKPEELINYMLPAYFSDPKFPVPNEMKKTSYHLKVGQKTLSESGNWDFRPEMKAITCPVLFIWGEDDPFGLEMAAATKKALVNARMTQVTLKKCGHYWYENMPDFLSTIRTFLIL